MSRKIVSSLAALTAACLVSAPTTAADFSMADPDVPYDGPTSPGFAAELGLWAGWLWRTGNGMNSGGGADDEDESLPLIGLNAGVAFPLGSTFIAQLDLDGELAFAELDGDNYKGSIVVGAHLAYGTMGGHSIGVFGAMGATDDEGDGNGDSQDATLWAAGVEGRAVMGNVSLLGQLGYLDADADEIEGLHEAWFVRGVARGAVNGGRTILEGELSYADGMQDEDDGDGLSLIGWGAEVEHEFGLSTPDRRVAGFLRYDGIYFHEDDTGGDDQKIVDHLVRGGLRVTWGGAGPGGGVPFSLPRFGHWVGGGSALD